MKAAPASACCFALMVSLLVIRGGSDWSRSFSILWYGLFVLSAVLGFAALVTAATRHDNQRTIVVVVALPVLAGLAYIAYMIIEVVQRVS